MPIIDLKLSVTDVFLRLLAGVLVAGFAGFLVGFIMRNYRDIFFAMLNTAISMVLFGIVAVSYTHLTLPTILLV